MATRWLLVAAASLTAMAIAALAAWLIRIMNPTPPEPEWNIDSDEPLPPFDQRLWP